MPDPTDLREVVHDLRNRLSAISSAANAIRKSNFESELGEEMVDIIRNNVERATETLKELSESRETNGHRP
ncbi:histidine kinase dimerization/phospho-acceptor domain-containing protein [Tautonia plasticadhaerens]|uniref:histidine kinase n=1 Tax=Tautonia plasticadhaerens TaxID=2527974 RepID=A0A518H2V0_9BACT|nr:histidine kinase dimerization/phospho-acceptor domain-containing protein [Tautonia plasticadhaerens]QDV35165.1 His Kinase A (phospho-acceptor) domain protein [Tautonia plasticadhaerens]